jgi:hypothetical protein
MRLVVGRFFSPLGEGGITSEGFRKVVKATYTASKILTNVSTYGYADCARKIHFMLFWFPDLMIRRGLGITCE